MNDLNEQEQKTRDRRGVEGATHMRELNLLLKRAFDIVLSISAVLLLTLIPVLVVVPLVIRLTSKGPAIFKQVRIGRDTKPFMMLKFRTMIVEQYNANGVEIMPEDRITRVGAFLRKTSLDELMQLFNILAGSMSFVGPRPMLDYQVGRCTEEEKRRFEMRPGVTGWAQVAGRNTITWTERIQYDLNYIDRFTFWLDFKILLKTVLVVLRKEGTDVEPQYRQIDRFSKHYRPLAHLNGTSVTEKHGKDTI